MQRVMITGSAGSGKSTLAIKMAAKTGLPLFHMDHIHYRPGWDERSNEEKDRLTHEVHLREEWIFEGGHSRTYADRIDRADLIIWLDISIWTRLWRCFWRSVLNRGKTRPDMQKDCPEKLDPDFFAFIWRTRNSSRERLKEQLEKASPKSKVRHFTSNKDADRFLESL